MPEKRLTREIAELLLADEDAVDLSEFTELGDDSAESLSKYEKDLDLDGLTSLSDSAAESFSTYKGGWLTLNGLASLSDAAAQSLAKSMGTVLCLNGLKTLSDVAAASLSKCQGWLELNLDNLTHSAAVLLRENHSFQKDGEEDECWTIGDQWWHFHGPGRRT